MTADVWLGNVASWSAQVLLLIAAAGLSAALLRLRAPGARLRLWQATLVASVLLPLLQPWERPALSTGSQTAISRTFSVSQQPIPTPTRCPYEQAAIAVLGAGIALRALWLALGMWCLRRYRSQARPLHPLPEAIETLRSSLSPDAVVCLSSSIASPVTFGFSQPVVLAPGWFLNLPARVQEAIACHEFLHVRRRDWAYTLAEELASALLWFHPAVWWLMGQVRLCREQAVDREVVELTSARDEYVEALLAVAGAKFNLAPAPQFLRRRRLVQRVGALLKEVSRSRRRLTFSIASVAVLSAATAWFAARAFPLYGEPQAPLQATAVISVQGGHVVLHRPPVEYPRDALEKRIEGPVVIDVRINDQGNVTDARVLSGSEELRAAAIRNALEWHFAKQGNLLSKAQIIVHFKLPEQLPTDSLKRVDQLIQVASSPVLSMPPGIKAIEGTVLKAIDLTAVPEPLRGTLRQRLAGFEGQPVTKDVVQTVVREAYQVDSHLELTWRISHAEAATLLSIQFTASSSAPPAAVNFPSSGEQRIRAGSAVMARKLIFRKPPAYPPLARQARLQGTVRFNVLLGGEGRVRNLVSGHPLLVEAATDALREWVYEPTLIGGKPVEVVTQVDVNFTLSDL